ncbi:MAG: DegV family protein, partial [Verrucomicrobiae bacterium]|nr:DegV family protein [Verrucomicrobiae bacterium]
MRGNRFSGGSGSTFAEAAALAAAAEFPPGRVTVFDSLSLSQGQGVQVAEAARLAEAGASAEEIVRHLRDLQRRIHVFIVLDTLEY